MMIGTRIDVLPPVNDVLQSLRSLGPVRLATIGVVGLLLFGFFAFLMTKMTDKELAVLYSDLLPADSGAVTAHLDGMGVAYEMSPDGNRILVPRAMVGEVRMELAQAGLPSNGNITGYELFDEQSGFGTTQAVQDINQVRALEGELGRTISALAPIRSARIHLVLPKRELFSRDEQPASASVLLQLLPSAKISAEQVAAIQHLVAAAVPKLEPTRVSISDDRGNLLARGADSDDDVVLAQRSDEVARGYERRLTSAVVDLLGRMVGYDNVMATVTAELDFDQVQQQITSFDPDQQIPISTVFSESSREIRDSSGSNAVTVQNNLPGAGGEEAGNQSSDAEAQTTETTNFEIGRTVTNTVRAPGRVKRLSVAVVVDGSYQAAEDGNRSYVPRSEEEMQRIAALVKSAVGFDEERGDTVEVTTMQFAEDDFTIDEQGPPLIFGFERAELLRVAETVVMALVGMLVLLMVVRPVLSRILEDAREAREIARQQEALLAEQASDPLNALPPPQEMVESLANEDGDADERMIDIHQVEGKVKESSLRKIGELVNQHPGEAVAILRSWMYQEA